MKKLFVLTALAATAGILHAEDSHIFQASLTPDIAIFPKDAEIHGLALSIWGENPQQGLALGIVNGSSGDSAGFSWGIFNYSEMYTGVSWAVVNMNKTSFHGWQSGLVNISQDEFMGFQSAWAFNYAKRATGLQLGLVNYAESLNGVQIGLANIVRDNPWFTEFPDKLATGFPIVNWSF